MMKHLLHASLRQPAFLLCALAIAAPMRGQAVAPAATPAQLARYDTNRNGQLDPTEVDAMRAEEARAAQAVTTTSTTPGTGNVIEMSPFTVQSDADSGYYAQNTVFGSRLNTNIGDLAASITVVTKQQLEDTGAVDINDVFLYEANTEGAGTYTPTLLSRGSARDGIAGYSADQGESFGIATANRVRGLGSADTAQNNYPTIARLAFDSYNTNSVEISRGPNSMLFGTGSASGIINQSTSEAVLNQRSTRVQARYGSFDSWRASISTNVPLGTKVAIFGAALYDDRGFQRKPSSDVYRRQTIAATYQPFSKTKITASFENYDNYNNRPNFASPIDYVTPWRASGRPSWNPTTQMVTLADTGQTFGPYLIDTRDPRYAAALANGITLPVGNGALTGTTSAFFIPGITFPGRTRVRYDNGQIIGGWVDQALSGGTATGTSPLALYAAPPAASRTAAQWLAASARYTTSTDLPSPRPPASTGATQWGNWYEVAVTDQSVYDWEKYNLQGANYGTQKAKTYNIEVQQQIFKGLNLSLGWFRQEFKDHNHYGLGQVNDPLRLYVDTNTHYLDGTPNPYYGAPYVQDWQADDFYRPEINNNLRAMLAYEVDFNQRRGFTRFLGKHRFLGLGSRQSTWQNNLRYRVSMDGGDPRFLPANQLLGTPFAWGQNSATLARYYYLGQGGEDGAVSQGLRGPGAPGYGGADHFSLRFYDWTRGAYSNSEMNFHNNAFYAGRVGVTTKQIDSKSFAWQAYLWKDRLIPTFGWREDRLKIRENDRSGLTTAVLYPGGFGTDEYTGILGDPFYVKGSTKTVGGVIKPFLGWSSIDAAGDRGNFFANLARGASFHYNESSNFNAPPSRLTDFFYNVLGKPSGKGKDYGVGFSLFENKLVVRLNWYESSDENAHAAVADTAKTRTVRVDTTAARDWATAVVRLRHGEDPTVPGWGNFGNNTTNPLTEQMAAEIEALWGLPFNLEDSWPAGNNIQGTQSNRSKGKELQMTYNPTRSWTMKLTVGQQEATYDKAVKELTDWITFRKPTWESLAAPDLETVYTKSNGNLLYVGKFWTGYGFSSDAGSNTTGPTGTPSSFFASAVEPQIFQVTAQAGAKQPNLREWKSTFLTSYNVREGRFRGFGIGGSLRWEDRAVAGYYGETDPTRYAHPAPGESSIVYPDLARPIYVPAETNVDLWLSYTRRIMSDKVRLKVQLNVRDLTEKGGLQAILFNPDGSPAQYRIKDPRTYFLTTTFDF